MQLSTPTSSDPNLLTLLFPAPAAASSVAPTAPATPGAMLDFDALLAEPGVAAPTATMPAAVMSADGVAPLTPPAVAVPTATVAAAPRAWPFMMPRPGNAAAEPAPNDVVDANGMADVDMEAEAAAEKPTIILPRAGESKIPEGEWRRAPRAKRDEDATLSDGAMPLVLPVEVTPVTLAIGLPAEQRFAVEYDAASAADEAEAASEPAAIGRELGGRAVRSSFAFAREAFRGEIAQPTSLAVDLAATDDAAEATVPFAFARPAAIPFSAANETGAPQADTTVDAATPTAASSALALESSTIALPAVPLDRSLFRMRPMTIAADQAPERRENSVAATSVRSPLAGEREAPAPGLDFAATPALRATQALSLPMSPASAPVDVERAPKTEAPQQAAEFAVNFDAGLADEMSREIAPPRNFVSSSSKQLTSRVADLGTGVAKPAAEMPSASTLPRPPHAAFESASLLVESFDGAQGGRADGAGLVAPDAAPDFAPPPEAVSNAHRAVEAVLTAAQRYDAGDRHAVSLQFSVGGTDLNVRVELRADEVRATFHTDSPELRAALSHEWQAAAANGDRALRLAPAAFTSGGAPGFSAFSGDHASQQQQRQSAARTPEEMFSFAAARGGSSRDAASADVSVSPQPRAPLSTALHLHTLA